MDNSQEFGLPQRPPRQRGRSLKRAKVQGSQEFNVEQAGAQDTAPPLASAEPAPPAAEAEVAIESSQQQQDLEQRQQPHDQQEQPDEKESAAGGEDITAAQLELPAYRSAAVGDYKFEYLDHTADVQLHAWGATLTEALENVALCMFNYMTPLKGITIDPALTRQYQAEGHDLKSLLFNFLDELLFSFCTDFFVPCQMHITSLDRTTWRIEAEGQGERFDRERHVSGTEVKAITFSAMQINETPEDAEVFVIVDI